MVVLFIPLVTRFKEPVGIDIWYNIDDQACIVRCEQLTDYHKRNPCVHGNDMELIVEHKNVNGFIPYFNVIKSCCPETRQYYEDISKVARVALGIDDASTLAIPKI